MPRRTKTPILAMLTAAATLLAGCSGSLAQSLFAPERAAEPTRKPGATNTSTNTTDPVSGNFAQWRAGFRVKALAAGISAAVFDRAFAGVRLNRKVIELDRRQPEFSRAIWQYLDNAISQTRINTAKQQLRNKATLLRGIQSKYGVDSAVVIAIWGLESNFGGNFGNFSVIETMATLAYEGRRREFAEEELIAALKIIQAGDVSAGGLLGSWAGAMGHTQFIPSSYLRFAVDHDGNGRRDIWEPRAVDALASTAKYLAHFGWRLGQPAYVEVRVPDGFNYAQASDKVRLTAAEWRARGIRALSGNLPDSDGVSIILPGGARGPAFAVYPNFRVIKRYNNATSYALAVAHLAVRMTGGPRIQAAWPRDDRMLSRTEKKELQQRLTALGYDTQGVDGVIGPDSREAVRAFQLARGLTPDGYVSARILSAVRAAGG